MSTRVVCGAVCGAAWAVVSGANALAQPSQEPFPRALALSRIDAAQGFTLDGPVAGAGFGRSLAGQGDVNGDGIDDLVIGAPASDPSGLDGAGSCFVVFGRADGGFGGSVDVTGLDGSNGFRIDGANAGDGIGITVALADHNGDGVDDIAIGAGIRRSGDEPNGAVYVVHGRRSGFPAGFSVAELDGTNGFCIVPSARGDNIGSALANAGDVNNDGYADLLIGAPAGQLGGRFGAGKAFVVYGAPGGFPPVFDLAGVDGRNGLVFLGVSQRDSLGESVAGVGDANGDGVDDMVLGASRLDAAGRQDAGGAYLVYGRDPLAGAPFPSRVDLVDINGENGYLLLGDTAGDFTGTAVAPAGDVNGDGLTDALVGAWAADTMGRINTGSTYVLLGSRLPMPAQVDARTLDGVVGFRIDGAKAGEFSAWSVSGAGDVDGDRIDDLLIGSSEGGDGVTVFAEGYLVYGRSDAGSPFLPAVGLRLLDGRTGFGLLDDRATRPSAARVQGLGDLNGDGAPDFGVATVGDEQAGSGGVFFGRVYVVYGRRFACRPDLDRDGELTLADFLRFQNAFDLARPVADFDRNRTWNVFDFVAYIDAFSRGCS